MNTGPGGGNSAAIAEFGVDTHQIDSAAGYAEHVGSIMVNEVNRLMANLEGLHGRWSGDVYQTAFLPAKQQWETAQQNLRGALDQIVEGLRKTGGAYDQASLDAASGIRKSVSDLTYS